jgi:DNA-binding CsgD family transcriptional regulator
MGLAADIEQIVPVIYDAALDTAAWPRVLDGLLAMFGGHCGSLISRRPDGSGGRCIETGFDPKALEEFFGYYRSRNVLLERGRHRPAGDIVSDRDILPKAEFLQSEYYNDLLLKQENTNAIMTAFLWRDRDRFVVFNCNRAPGLPEYEEADKARLRPLMGHLGRAIEVALRLDTFDTASAHELARFDSTTHGVLVLDDAGSVLYANPAGERLLAEQDGILVESGAVGAATLSLTAALRAAIARAASGNDSGALTLARPRRGRPLHAIATPLPPEVSWLQPARRRVLLLLRDPAERPELNQRYLQQLFGLTAAEARLTLRLYDGEDLVAASTALGISRHTARAHLTAVLGKTESDRQAELIRRLSAIAELAARQPVGGAGRA